MNDNFPASEKAVGEATPVVPDETDAPEPKPTEPVKAWVVGYGELGLINVVADSQTELVNRIANMRHAAGLSIMGGGANPLEPVEVLSNAPGEQVTSTIWIDPLLILAVMDQFMPRVAREDTGGLRLPPGLEALLAGVAEPAGPGSGSEEEDSVEVVVGSEPPQEPGEHD